MVRTYFTNLREDRIVDSGHGKMRAMLQAAGFPPALWSEDVPGEGPPSTSMEGLALAARVGHHLAAIRGSGTGESYKNTEVACMSVGVLTEEDVGGIRSGKVSDPTVGQVAGFAKRSTCT